MTEQQYEDNYRACMTCPLTRKLSCYGPCVCPADRLRRDLQWHAKAHDCPKGRYSVRGLGDRLAGWLDKVVIGRWWKDRADRKGKPCGCRKKAEALNKAFPAKG